MAATHSLDLESSSSQYASIADASCPNLEISGSQTYEGWIKTESTGTNKVIVAKGKASTAIYHQLAVNSSTEQLDVYIVGLTTNDFLRSNTVIQTGVWYHVAGVYDSSAGKLRIYINGELDKEVTAGGTASDTNSNFAIGCNFSGGSDAAASFFDGLLRNVRVWNVARTQAQIRADMNVDTPSVTTGLQGNWILNNAYTDSSGNGYTLTASGSPTFSTTYPDAIDLVENSNWTANKKLTLNVSSLSLSGDLTDVPVPLTESIFSTGVKDAVFAAAKSDGSDVRFSTDIDGKIRLAHELVSWDNSGKTMEIHLKINSLDVDADNTIYMHYGNSGASALNENEAFGKHQVYPLAWKAVYHMQEASGSRLDSTRNSYDLTDNNTVLSGTGKLGTAADFERTNSESLTINNNLGIGGGDVTILTWHKFESFANNTVEKPSVISLYDDTAKVDYRIYSYLNTNNYVSVARHRPGVAWDNITEEILATDTWYHLVLRYSSTTLSYIRDGVVKNSATVSGGGLGTFTTGLSVGATRGMLSTFYADGLSDQVMIYSGALSDDFIKALYNLQNDPAGFIEVEESSNGNFFMFL